MLISCQYIYLLHRNAFTIAYIIIVKDTCTKLKHMTPLFFRNSLNCKCYRWGGVMGHRPIQSKNGPLTIEIAILNLERMAIEISSLLVISGKWPIPWFAQL